MQIPLPGVLADYAFYDLEQVFVHGFGQAISSRLIRGRSRENYILLLTQLENFLRNESSTIIANDIKRNAEAGEYEILQNVHHLFGFRILKRDGFSPSSEIIGHN